MKRERTTSDLKSVRRKLAQRKKKLWQLLGRNQDRRSKNVRFSQARVNSQSKGWGYLRCDDVSYMVGQERVSAYLLTPSPSSKILKYPAIIVVHSNAGDYTRGREKAMGRVGKHDAGLAVQLARQGFVVLVPDLRGFGARQRGCHNYHLAKHPKGGEVGMLNEWTYLLTQGKTLLGENLHELQAGITYLQQCKLVDPQRIGVIGHSGGGIVATYLAALDDRIKVGASACAVASYAAKMKAKVKLDDNFVIPNILTNFGDTDQVMTLLGGKPFLVLSTTKDCYCLDAKQVCRKARAQLPKELRTIQSSVWPGRHKFSQPMRKKAFDFLHRHLN